MDRKRLMPFHGQRSPAGPGQSPLNLPSPSCSLCLMVSLVIPPIQYPLFIISGPLHMLFPVSTVLPFPTEPPRSSSQYSLSQHEQQLVILVLLCLPTYSFIHSIIHFWLSSLLECQPPEARVPISFLSHSQYPAWCQPQRRHLINSTE